MLHVWIDLINISHQLQSSLTADALIMKTGIRIIVQSVQKLRDAHGVKR